MSSIECKDIDYILALATNGSVTEAADSLFISQAGLTKYLKHLEERLGIDLFFHNKKPLTLTDAGKLYIHYAEQISILKNKLDSEILTIQRGDIEQLRVGFSSNGLRKHIYNAAQHISLEIPSVRIILDEYTTSDIEKMLLSRDLDIGFITLSPRQTAIKSELLLQEELLLAVPCSNPLSTMGTPCYSQSFETIDLKLFRDEPFVLRREGTWFREYSDALFERAQFLPKIIATARNNFSCLEFASFCSVCTITTKSYIDSMSTKENLRFFIIGPEPKCLFSGVAYTRDQELKLLSNKFIELVRNDVIASL